MSRCGHYQGYNDDWIYAHITKFTSWRKMFDAYYEEFHFGNYRNFRNHLYHDLGMTRIFTDEQNNWLIDNYPNMTLDECTEAFNKQFQIGRSKSTIRMQASKLGVRQSDDTVRRAYDFEHYNEYPIGSTVIRTNNKGLSAVYEKTADGWIRQSILNAGQVPEGFRVVHLNRDFMNNSEENLAVVPIRILSMMTGNKFWSDNPEITKTAILWCKLSEVLAYEQIVNAR